MRNSVCYRSLLSALATIALLGVGGDPLLLRSIPLHGSQRIRIEASGGPLYVTTGSSHRRTAIRLRVAYATARPPTVESYTHDRWLDVSILTSGSSNIPFAGANPTRFDVRVPRMLPIQIHAFNGNVTDKNPTAAVQVDDGTGDISITNARAGVDLATERGNVGATLAPHWKPSEVRLETGNGDVSLSVPANFRGHVVIGAPSGHVQNALSANAMHAAAPFIWLYTATGNASITVANH